MGDLRLQGGSDVDVEAVGARLVVQSLLHLQHDLLLKKLFLLLFDLWWLWLLGRPASLVPLIYHLNSETFDREAEVYWDLGQVSPWLSRCVLRDLDLSLGVRKSAVFRLALPRAYNHQGTVCLLGLGDSLCCGCLSMSGQILQVSHGNLESCGLLEILGRS
jgi:hypothetical protein